MTDYEKLAFDKNLQEFANRVANICGLESGGKLSQEEAYQYIKTWWKQLKRSRKGLRIDEKDTTQGEQEGESLD